jgi:hypothetical protein
VEIEMRQTYRPVTCARCDVEFAPNSPRHFYCGTRGTQTGCAWIVYQEQSKRAKTKYYEANRDAVIQRTAEWQKRNPEKVIEAGAKNRAKYQEYYKEKRKEYKQKAKGLVNANTAKRFASKLRATPKWSYKKAIVEKYKTAVNLTQSTGIPHHVDHIIPLRSKTVCGLHVEWNLRVLPASINTSKSNKYLQVDALAFWP